MNKAINNLISFILFIGIFFITVVVSKFCGIHIVLGYIAVMINVWGFCIYNEVLKDKEKRK